MRRSAGAMVALTLVAAVLGAADPSAAATSGSGSVAAFGSNDYGELGDGTTMERHAPTAVPGLEDVISVAAGGFSFAGAHSVALTGDGTVYVWGRNRHGELGDGTTTDRHAPVKVALEGTFTAVAVSAWHSLALDSHVWAWGDNSCGELGAPPGADRNAPVPTPAPVNGLDGITAIAAGSASNSGF